MPTVQTLFKIGSISQRCKPMHAYKYATSFWSNYELSCQNFISATRLSKFRKNQTHSGGRPSLYWRRTI